jgi:hypothetical protein
MDFVDARPERGRGAAVRAQPPVPVKIVVAGAFGVGKTTAVASISEIPPLTTEAAMTTAAADVDRRDLVPDKTTTTVAMDFGRITIDETLKLYLFGTPGQERFGFMWDDIARGALGALVMVDTRRLEDCFAAVDFFERLDLPFVVAVNRFDGELLHDLDDVRWALAVDPAVPVVSFDARRFLSVRDALLVVLHEALRAAREGGPTPVEGAGSRVPGGLES